MNTELRETGLFKLHIPMKRSSDLEGVFIAPKSYIDYIIKNAIVIYWGEIAGKHSEVYGSIKSEEITLITDDPAIIKIVFDYNLQSGLNPLDYLEEDYFENIEL